jgi:hypothetical protein
MLIHDRSSRYVGMAGEAAQILKIAPNTLRLAAEAGEIESIHPLSGGAWIFARAALTTSAARSITERRGRTQSTPQDRILTSKTPSYQSHSQMGVPMHGCSDAANLG